MSSIFLALQNPQSGSSRKLDVICSPHVACSPHVMPWAEHATCNQHINHKTTNNFVSMLIYISLQNMSLLSWILRKL